MSQNRPIVGKDCYVYIDAGATANEWIWGKQAKGVTCNRSKTAADASAKYAGTNLAVGGMKSEDISFDYIYVKNKDDEFLDALQDSYYNDTPMRVVVLDGDILTDGHQGPYGAYECFTLNLVQELDGTMMFNVTLQPTYLEDDDGNPIEPYWYEVGGAIEPLAAPQLVEVTTSTGYPVESDTFDDE